MIYLDNAATTRPLPFRGDCDAAFWANPSSPHRMGIAAERTMTQARRQLTDILQCKPNELYFTSGGTESNNLAILGYVLAQAKKNRALRDGMNNLFPVGTNFMIYAEPWAHPSVLAPIHYAAEQGLAAACIAPVADWPLYNAPALACLSHVNHETGDIADIAAIAQSIKSQNPAAVIFVDGAQGFCKEKPLPPSAADMYAFSGHKCHGPTGTGGLVVRGNIAVAPLMHGGGQEYNIRPGTENLAGILHMAHAAQELHTHQDAHYQKISCLKETLLKEALRFGCQNHLTTSLSPYIVNLSFPGTRGEVLVHMLSEKGISVSMGAACKSRKRDKSALAVMGFSKEISESALRFSFSHMNTQEEIIETARVLETCVNQLRKISGYKYESGNP